MLRFLGGVEVFRWFGFLGSRAGVCPHPNPYLPPKNHLDPPHPTLRVVLTSSLKTCSQFLCRYGVFLYLVMCKMYFVFIESKCRYFYHCPIACIPLPHLVLCTEIVSAVKMQVYRAAVHNSCTVTGQQSRGNRDT